MSVPSPAVVCDGLTFAWPDGTLVLDGLALTFDPGRTALIGRNGAGKSTLLRLIAGDLAPTSGRVTRSGDLGHLAQQLPLQTTSTVADLLGVDDEWDFDHRAVATLDRMGVPGDLERTVATLSGGETVLTALAGLLVRRPAVTLLDEPTNDLDRAARETLYAAVRSWPGTLIVVSHDRELLECVDRIVELRDGAARSFGGTFGEFETALAAEQDAAQRTVRVAEGDLRRERRQQIEAHSRLAQRRRTAAKTYADKRGQRIVMRTRDSQAQVSAAKYREVHDSKVVEAQRTLAAAESLVRDDDSIRIDLPATAVPAGRTVLDFEQVVVRGPERIAVLGANGAGKTTLLRRLIPLAKVPVGYLPQRLDVLDPQLSVLANVCAATPAATPHDVRAQLARFLLRGARVELPARALSGGERFRAALACVLLADPAPQLLMLDEPTNNLDLDSTAQLVDALRAYRGALLVASHDERFLADLGIDRRWHVQRGRAQPTEV